jgi:hypothetical protein
MTSGENCDSCCSGGMVRLDLAAKFDVAIRRLTSAEVLQFCGFAFGELRGFSVSYTGSYHNQDRLYSDDRFRKVCHPGDVYAEALVGNA